jgi:DNA-binding NarL/FixJ family response regulator
LIADDHPVVREGLVTILKSEKDIKVIAEAADGKKTCELYGTHHVGVLPKWHGITSTKKVVSG